MTARSANPDSATSPVLLRGDIDGIALLSLNRPEARNTLSEAMLTALQEQFASIATDDKVRAYAGEDYERVLIRAMLSISNLMSNGGDAGAYALQMVDKQQQIIQAVEEKYR